MNIYKFGFGGYDEYCPKEYSHEKKMSKKEFLELVGQALKNAVKTQFEKRSKEVSDKWDKTKNIENLWEISVSMADAIGYDSQWSSDDDELFDDEMGKLGFSRVKYCHNVCFWGSSTIVAEFFNEERFPTQLDDHINSDPKGVDLDQLKIHKMIREELNLKYPVEKQVSK